MKKFNYIFVTLVNSVGFLFIFGSLVIMQIEIGKWNSEINSLNRDLADTRSAYTRFIDGRTLNSDYEFWKKIDIKHSSSKLKKIDQVEFLKGVAVFQRAFWNKYLKKKNIKTEFKNHSWADAIKHTDKNLLGKIQKRFPIKDEIGRRLNGIVNAVEFRLFDVINEHQNVRYNLFWQYAIFCFYLLFNFIFYYRRELKNSALTNRRYDSGNLEHLPAFVIKIHDEKIYSFSKKLKELTPKIEENTNWEDFFISNFSIVKNLSGLKIVVPRSKMKTRLKLESNINGAFRYIVLTPIITITQEKSDIPAGNDSLSEIIKESIHRIELMCPKLSFNFELGEDVLIDEMMAQKVEESISLLGTFYKRIAVMQKRNIDLSLSILINRNNIGLSFNCKNLRLDSDMMRNISNFNFSYYPQKIEKVLSKHSGKVSIKNRFSRNRKFNSSEFNVNFELRTEKILVKNKQDKVLDVLN